MIHAERSPTLAAARRYYPGFWGALFLVLLRIAIGWHFLTEGLYKLDPPDGKSFSAEGYLRNSAGPLAPTFRAMVPDVDSLKLLHRDRNGRPDQLKQDWTDELERVAAQYGFSPEQKQRAQEAVDETVAKANGWFADLGNSQKLDKYVADIERIKTREADPKTLRAEREAMTKERAGLEKTRRELIGPVTGWTTELRGKWAQVVTEEQRTQHGWPPAPPKSELDLVNKTVSWGLTLFGACLILGLFTPVAALGGAALLALFYISNPPWPGLPEPPQSEGHYLFVNKNLIELFACLALAATPNGLWIGLDALLFGWIGRRRDAEDLAGTVPPVQPPGSNPVRPRGTDPVKPVPVTRS